MTRQQYIINRKLNIVELAEKLGNITKACRNLGVSRQHYYDIKAALEEEDIEGLLEKTRTNPRVKNRVAQEIEQRLLDYFSNVGFAKLYLEKTALTAADFLNDKVPPFFDSQSVSWLMTLTGRGAEHCGIRENHAYQLYLYINNIDHTWTKARHPQTNGCTERINY